MPVRVDPSRGSAAPLGIAACKAAWLQRVLPPLNAEGGGEQLLLQQLQTGVGCGPALGTPAGVEKGLVTDLDTPQVGLAVVYALDGLIC